MGTFDGDDRVRVDVTIGARTDTWSRTMDELAPIGWFTNCVEQPLYSRDPKTKRLVKSDGSELLDL
jgi:hypothetical protein